MFFSKSLLRAPPCRACCRLRVLSCHFVLCPDGRCRSRSVWWGSTDILCRMTFNVVHFTGSLHWSSLQSQPWDPNPCVFCFLSESRRGAHKVKCIHEQKHIFHQTSDCVIPVVWQECFDAAIFLIFRWFSFHSPFVSSTSWNTAISDFLSGKSCLFALFQNVNQCQEPNERQVMLNFDSIRVSGNCSHQLSTAVLLWCMIAGSV